MTQTLLTSSGTLITQSIDSLKKYAPADGYYLAFSGGKDSIVCYDLLEKSGIDFDAHYNVTTIDPPQLTRFIREYYPEVEWHRPTYKGKPTNFYQLIALKGLPNRRVRWCCDVLKEGRGRREGIVVTGVRAEESANRAKYPEYDVMPKTKQRILKPIFWWKTNDVWDYIDDRGLPYPELYDYGWERIGCIMCPMACIHKRRRDMHAFPAHAAAMKKNLAVFLENHPESPLFRWGVTADEIFHRWIAETPATDESGQCTLGGIVW